MIFYRHPSRKLLAIAIGMLVAVPVVGGSKSIRINLGTIAPRGSSYHRALQTMAQQWGKLSDGRVRVIVYPDSTLGGEADMIRLIRNDALQAALITANGLASIEPSASGLQSMPMRFRDLAEFAYVNEKLRPVVEPRLEDKGFVVLCWIDAGWVRYFSKEPVLLPEDLRSKKVFAWGGDPEVVKIMRRFGLNPIALEAGEIQGGLRRNLIDTVAVPPIYALAGRIDEQAPHMLDLNWAPLVGALVIDREVWNKIPASLHADLMHAAQEAGVQIQSSSHRENDDAVVAMQKRGLQVHTLTPEQQAAWEAEAETELLPLIRGTLVPTETYDQALYYVQEYRQKDAAGSE